MKKFSQVPFSIQLIRHYHGVVSTLFLIIVTFSHKAYIKYKLNRDCRQKKNLRFYSQHLLISVFP